MGIGKNVHIIQTNSQTHICLWRFRLCTNRNRSLNIGKFVLNFETKSISAYIEAPEICIYVIRWQKLNFVSFQSNLEFWIQKTKKNPMKIEKSFFCKVASSVSISEYILVECLYTLTLSWQAWHAKWELYGGVCAIKFIKIQY